MSLKLFGRYLNAVDDEANIEKCIPDFDESDPKRILNCSLAKIQNNLLVVEHPDESNSKSSSPKLKSNKSFDDLSTRSDESDSSKSSSPKLTPSDSWIIKLRALCSSFQQKSNEYDTDLWDYYELPKRKSNESMEELRVDDTDLCDSYDFNERVESYGNLPDYVASLVKKMPIEPPVRPGKIIKLTPTQQKYKLGDPVVPPAFALGNLIEQTLAYGPDVAIVAKRRVDEAIKRREDPDTEILSAKRLIAEAIERKEDPDPHVFRYTGKGSEQALATAALSYMFEKGQSLELVKPSLFQCGRIHTSLVAHFNFQAKRTDILDAPVETYFAQMRIYGHIVGDPEIIVDCCVSLGQSDLLPYERDNRGCQYCTKYVHHPVNGCVGMKWGFTRWSEEKNEFVVI